MPWLKSVSEKLQQKKRDLEREAAERAARAAVERGAQAVTEAFASASKSLETALFGPDDAERAAGTSASPTNASSPHTHEDDARRAAEERARAEKTLDAEVDAELAAMKKRLGK